MRPSQGDFFVLGVGAFHVWDFGWIGQVVNHTVERILMFLVRIRRTLRNPLVPGPLSDGTGCPLRSVRLRLRGTSPSDRHQIAKRFRSSPSGTWWRTLAVLQGCHALRPLHLVAGEEVGPHGDQVDHAFQGVAGFNWNLHRNWDDTEAR